MLANLVLSHCHKIVCDRHSVLCPRILWRRRWRGERRYGASCIAPTSKKTHVVLESSPSTVGRQTAYRSQFVQLELMRLNLIRREER